MVPNKGNLLKQDFIHRVVELQVWWRHKLKIIWCKLLLKEMPSVKNNNKWTHVLSIWEGKMQWLRDRIVNFLNEENSSKKWILKRNKEGMRLKAWGRCNWCRRILTETYGINKGRRVLMPWLIVDAGMYRWIKLNEPI